MNLTARKAVRYFTLPEVFPRLKRIFSSGFSYVSYYMACVLNIARLLPNNHPYLNPANAGKYGIHHVLAQAWVNLTFKKENIDQIIIFFSLLFGVVLLFVQIMMFVMALFVPVAHAAIGTEFARLFETVAPDEDLAFMFLDRVFGMPGLFNSSALAPNNFHDGLHELFGYYNTGLAIVAFLIILYYVIALTAETAKTGVPFGKRFNHAMAPLRLIIALALLVPISSGMNSAQMITFYAAKYGSGLATNGWQTFLDEIVGSTLLGDPDTLVVTPKPPQVNALIEFMFVAQTCKFAYELSTENETDPTKRYGIRPYVILENDAFAPLGTAPATDLNGILANNNNKNVTIRFGHQNGDWFPEYASYVNPLCGEIEIILQDIEEPGAYYVQNAYIFDLILGLWNDVPNETYARSLARNRLTMVSGRDPTLDKPTPDFIQDTFTFFNDMAEDIVEDGVLEEVTNGNWIEDFTKYGWGGAAIWYNKIAQFNGSLISSVYNLPVAKRYPVIMEKVLEAKKAQNNNFPGRERFNPVLAGGIKIFTTSKEAQFSELFYEAQTFWIQTQDKNTGNFWKDAVNMLLGFEGLINMRDNEDIHPLAQLVGIGRGLIESAVQNFGYMTASAVGGLVGGPVGMIASNARSFFSSIAMIGMSLGFVLFYVLPFLPFLYFFIALTNWVKTIFEAMVGLPLWALSHIRIDGDGLPGPAGMNGYYLIFEIFVNPILIVFGMLAGITIFSAQVVVLNEIWGLVVTNVTGYDPATINPTDEDKMNSIRYLRGAFDKFFYTCMYAVFVYMMGLASFKLVDAIPDRILRWMGASVKSFNETADNLAGELIGKSYQVSQSTVGNVDTVMAQMMTRNS